MENIIFYQFNWFNFLVWGFVFGLFYFVLRVLQSVFEKIELFGRYQNTILKGLRYLLLLYEPIGILLLGSLFFMINPVLHGLILLLLFVGGFHIVKDYISGLILQFDVSIVKGNRLSTENIQGIISDIGRLGLKLRNNKGLQFINYASLFSDGYLLLSGDEIGAYYHLKITPKDIEARINHERKLKDLFVTTPYLDWQHQPKLKITDEINKQIQAKVMVKEERHLHDLLALINEWGYQCKISKK